MMRLARWGTLLLLGLIALVFFGSVLCPPLEERGAEETGESVQYPLQEDPGTYRPLPGPIQIEDRFPVGPPPPPPEATPHDRIEVRVVDEEGRPVQDAEVVVRTEAASSVARARGRTGSDGAYHSPRLFPESLLVEVHHAEHFPEVRGPFRLPSDRAVEVAVLLRPAACFTGKVVGTDGRPRTFGRVHLERLDVPSSADPEIAMERIVPIDAGGLFRSPALESGHWRIRWTARPTAEQDPALQFALPLAPKQTCHLRITVPSGSGKPLSGDDVHAIGISQVFP